MPYKVFHRKIYTYLSYLLYRMVERIYPEDYFNKPEKLEEIPYIIPLPVWILLGIAIIGAIAVALYAISKIKKE